jgi:DNA-binding winged helix-turn-helix (wHTH) protein
MPPPAWLAQATPVNHADRVFIAYRLPQGAFYRRILSIPPSDPPLGLAFGRFRVLPKHRELLADGRPVKLGGRAFDVLMALIEAHGAVVSKDALMARVWPGRIIEENSLAAQIVALRAGFGAERALIRTVSGRGYQFAGEIRNSVAEPGWSSVVAKLRRSAWRRRSPTGACCWRWTPASM